jgi:hypothetical protein
VVEGPAAEGNASEGACAPPALAPESWRCAQPCEMAAAEATSDGVAALDNAEPVAIESAEPGVTPMDVAGGESSSGNGTIAAEPTAEPMAAASGAAAVAASGAAAATAAGAAAEPTPPGPGDPPGAPAAAASAPDAGGTAAPSDDAANPAAPETEPVVAAAPKRKRSRKPAGSSKRAKNGKDPLAPKKAKTAFICFCERERPRLMTLHPGAPPTDITKLCGEGWKKLSEEERKPYVDLAGADKMRYHEALKTYEPPPDAVAPTLALPLSSPAVLQQAMLAEAKAFQERRLKLDSPDRAQRCGCVLGALRARQAQSSGTDETRSDFLRSVMGKLDSKTYPSVREFAQDVRQTLFALSIVQGAPTLPADKVVGPSAEAAESSAELAPALEAQAAEPRADDQAAAEAGQVPVKPLLSLAERRLLGHKFERLLDSWVISPRQKELVVGELDETSCQTCHTDPESKRANKMQCIECDVTQHSCCLVPAPGVKPDHWCCNLCVRRVEAECTYLADSADTAKSKRKHRRTKGEESEANYTLSTTGKYVCDGCRREYETESAVKGHCTKGCDGGDWTCTWCGGSGKTGQEDGPDGPATLCAACHSRFCGGAKSRAVEQAGMLLCDTCGKRCANVIGLAAHMRTCDGGQWRCKWCKTDAHGQMPGPDGPGTLCNSCGSCFQGRLRTQPAQILPAGESSDQWKQAPKTSSAGDYFCERGCRKHFESMEGLLAHQCVCTGSSSQCDFCVAPAEVPALNPADPYTVHEKPPELGPEKPNRSLCAACATKFRPKKSIEKSSAPKGSKHTCPQCSKVFDSTLGLSGHQRFCDGGNWRCEWCQCQAEVSKGKSPGPNGAGTLCSTCGSRFRGGATGPPKQNSAGKFICETCERTFESVVGLSSHRRGCSGKVLGAKPQKKKKKTLGDDLDVFSTLIHTQKLAPNASAKPDAIQTTHAPDPRLSLGQASLAAGQAGLPPEVLPDLLCLAEFFSAFHEQLTVPHLTVEQLASILTSPGRLELAETICCAMTKHVVQLSQSAPMPCGPTYFKYEREHFFGIRAEQLSDFCLDGVTWEAVLHAYTSKHVPVLNINADMHATVTRMAEYGFGLLGMRQRLQILLYLTNEMLGTAHCRDIMNANLVETEMLDQANKEEKERRSKEEMDWAKEKAKRAPTAYNLYLQNELNKCKEEDPTILHKDAFAKSAANWKALDGDEMQVWAKRAKMHLDEEKLSPTEKQVLATLNSITQKIVDANNEQVQQQHQEILDKLTVRTISLGSDRYCNRYWVIPAFPDKLWVEDCFVLRASFRPPVVTTFLESKGDVKKRLATTQKRVVQMLDSVSVPVLRKSGKLLGLSFGDSEQKAAMIKELMAKDTDGIVVGDLLKRLGDHQSRYYAKSLLSLEELEEWSLVFPDTAKSAAVQDEQPPSSTTEEAHIANETQRTVGERLALTKELAEQVLERPGAVDRLGAEFYHRALPPAHLELPVAKPVVKVERKAATFAKSAGTKPEEKSVKGAESADDAKSSKEDQSDRPGDVAGAASGSAATVPVTEEVSIASIDDGSVAAGPSAGSDEQEDADDGDPVEEEAKNTENEQLREQIARAKALQQLSAALADSAPATNGGSNGGAKPARPAVTFAPAPASVLPAHAPSDAPVEVSAAAAATSDTAAGGGDSVDANADASANTAAPTAAVAVDDSSGADSLADAAAGEAAVANVPARQPRQRAPRSKKAATISLPPEITVRLEAAYQSNKAAETKARAAATRERTAQANAAAAASDNSLGLDRMQQTGECKACLGSHRAHTCGKRKTLVPDVLLKKPKLDPLAEIPNYDENEELEKMVEEQSKETGVDAAKIRQWFDQRRKTTTRRRGGGRTRSRAEQINELKSRSDPNWVPIGNKSKPQRDRTKERSHRARTAAAKAKQKAEEEALPPWEWDLDLPPLIPPELEKLPMQPAAAVGYWEESSTPSVHILKSSRWRCYEEVEEVDALLAQLNPAGVREAALRRRLLIQAPALKAAMTAAKVKARKAALEHEKLSKAAAVALARQEGGLSLRRSRSASASESVAEAGAASAAAAADDADASEDSAAAGVPERSEASRRCDLIKGILFKVLEALPTLPGRATHGDGRSKWRNAVSAAVANEDWRALVAPAQTLGLDVLMVGKAYERAIGNTAPRRKKGEPEPDPGGKLFRLASNHY